MCAASYPAWRGVGASQPSLIVFESRWQIEHRIICSLLRLPPRPPSLLPFFLHSLSITRLFPTERERSGRRGNWEVGLLAAPLVRSAAAVRSARFGKLEFVLLFCRIAPKLWQDARGSSRSEEKSRHRLLEREEASLPNYSFPVNIQQTFTHRCYNLESTHTSLVLIWIQFWEPYCLQLDDIRNKFVGIFDL